MSEQKLISPLLDGFSMGNPMSEHDGVRCCPAIKENTNKKYIVKIISIPASQVQMDALLLAGAYKDPADAMDYFRQIGEGVMKEAELLKTLSKLEGFLPYEAWQMEPITRRRLGYEIYLVSSYKRTLEKYLKQHPVTHLEAINLGLDLCSALSVCRQAGALYVDLKPNNIFVSEKREYRIGDLGFIELDALGYTALPDKYHSAYTPPELLDPMASLNMTVDTYSVGMILYQLYNDGQLPFKGIRNPETELPTPVNADYELAEIIMKAIHIDPEQRWTDPGELGKALASYMQRNSVNDVPITPHTPLDVKPEDILPVPKKKEQDKTPPDAVPQEPACQRAEAEEPAPIPEFEEVPAEPAEQAPAVPAEAILEEPSGEDTAEEAASAQIPPIRIPEERICAQIPEDTPEDAVAALGEAPDAPTGDALPQLSEEVSKIIAKADDLIAHETPAGVVLPAIPEAEDPFAFVAEDSDIPVDPDMDQEDIPSKQEKKSRKKTKKKFEDPKYKRRAKQFFQAVLTLLVLCLIGLAGFWYYQNLYLQTVESITIDGDRNQITVTVGSEADDSLLQVVCSDAYGKSKTQNLTNGQAVFTDLEPNTMYTIQLQISGFHALVGKTSDVFTTEATTTIVSFTSVAGAEDGSVMLNFTVDGQEPNDWTVFYSAEGETEMRKTFTGHTVTITDLSVGKVYTFTLDTGENIALGGQTTLELMASRLILAENLVITSDNGTDITVHWNAPGDVVVDRWDVRCYNDAGYEENVTVTDSQVVFPGIDPAASYTVEVTASGMTQPARTSITANPIRVSSVNVDASSHKKLTVTWDYTGNPPEDGWLLIYSFVGGQKNVVKCSKANATIPIKIPGAKYELTIQSADGTTVFNNISSYQCPEASVLDIHHLTADMLEVNLAKVPASEKWYTETLDAAAITDSFVSGEKIAIVMQSSDTFYMTGAEVDVLYVIRDAYGNVLPDLVSTETLYWKKIWNGGNAQNGELEIPKLPTNAGDYVLNLYFDGMEVAELDFKITQ